MVCATLGMSRGKTLLLSGDMLRKKLIVSAGSRRTSRAQGRRDRHCWRNRHVPLRKQLLRFPLSWPRTQIRLGTGSRQLGATWWKHHWIVHACPGDKRKATGASEEKSFPNSRVWLSWDVDRAGQAQIVKRNELAAGCVRLEASISGRTRFQRYRNWFRAAIKGRADAVLSTASADSDAQRTQIADLAVKNRLPAIYRSSEFVEAGAYELWRDFHDLYRRAATYVDKILKGAKPADCQSNSRRSSSS